MNLQDFHFDLPEAQIATFPLERRSSSRLLQVTEEGVKDGIFTDVIDLLEPGDLLIFNNTKVIPARFYGVKATGGKVEVLVERVLDDKRILVQMRVSKSPKEGGILTFANNIQFKILGRKEQFFELELQNNQDVMAVIDEIGEMPLPPYMQRQAGESDLERYQTVYAKHKGSVAAPTAGLHFDNELMDAIKEKGVQTAFLMLHIGAGTFSPVRVDNVKEHKMHSEYFEIDEALCEKIRRTKANGKRVIAVGTTSLRALESASQSGEIQPFKGETNIFIYPGYKFHCIDALITNLHLPSSTLLMLVCAFAGHPEMMQAYETAVKLNYRFYSYGDAMWLNRKA